MPGPNPRCAAIPVDNSLLLLDRSTGRLALLNESASLTWHAHRDGLPLADIASRVAEAFGVPEAVVRPDVERALSTWSELRLFDELDENPVSAAADLHDFDCANARIGRHSITHVYSILNRPVEICYQNRDLAERAHPCLAHFEVARATSSGRAISVYEIDGQHVVATPGAETVRHAAALDCLKTLVAGQVILSCYPRAQISGILHAGAVSNGRECIALPGISGAGKSTLTAALVHAGYDYFSDDFAPFDLDAAHVLPFPTAFSVKQGSWDVVASLFPALRDCPAYFHSQRWVRYFVPPRRAWEHLADGLPLKCLLFPRYQHGAAAALMPLAATDALRLILSTNSWLRPPFEAAGVARFARWIAEIPAFGLTYSSLADPVRVVQELLPR